MAKQQRRDRKPARELFPDDLLVLPIHAADKREVVTQLLNALVIEGVLPLEREDEVRQSILDREEVASTGIGCGVAIPHTKFKLADRFGVAVGISSEGVDFNAHDEMPARAIFLWVCPPSETPKHLALMRGVAALAKEHDLADKVANCRDKRSLFKVLERIEID